MRRMTSPVSGTLMLIMLWEKFFITAWNYCQPQIKELAGAEKFIGYSLKEVKI